MKSTGGLGANSGMPMLSLQESSGPLWDQFQTAVGETTTWASSTWTTWGIWASSVGAGGEEADVVAEVAAVASGLGSSPRRTALSSRSRAFVPKQVEEAVRKPATQPPTLQPNSSQEPPRQRRTSILKADLFASPPPASSKEDIPVKFTFIHYDEVDEEAEDSSADAMTRSSSAPGVLCSVPFCEKLTRMGWKHINGTCKPCAYFQDKEDGCRMGDDCSFCHICLPGELKKRKRVKKRALRVFTGKQWWSKAPKESAYAQY